MPSTREQAMRRIGVSVLTPEAVIDHQLGVGTVACYRSNDVSPGHVGYSAFMRLGQQMIDAAIADSPDVGPDQFRYEQTKNAMHSFFTTHIAPNISCSPGGGWFSIAGGGFFGGKMGIVNKIAAAVTVLLAAAGGVALLLEGDADKLSSPGRAESEI